MAKGARASSRKANNARLKSRVFGPIETARTERLSAKLLELASKPKPQKIAIMDVDTSNSVDSKENHTEINESEVMDIEKMSTKKNLSLKTCNNGRIKRKVPNRRASIVFKLYKKDKNFSKKAKP